MAPPGGHARGSAAGAGRALPAELSVEEGDPPLRLVAYERELRTPLGEALQGQPAHLENSGARKGLDIRAVWQVTSMSLGIGVFTIPHAFLQLGALHGAFWIIVLGLFADFALQALLDCAAALNITSYEGLTKHAFGDAGEVAMMLITIITTFIATLSYLGSVKEIFVGVVVAFFLDFDVNSGENGVAVLSKAKELVLLSVLAASVLPRCLGRSMGSNAWISTAGVLAITCASTFFVGHCAVKLVAGRGGPPPELFKFDSEDVSGSVGDILENVATLAFSFSMCFAVFEVLEERVVGGDVASAVDGLKPAVRMSVVFSCCIYLLVGLIGVFTFGTDTKTLALANTSLTDVLSLSINTVVGVSTLLLVAIVAFPTTHTLEKLCGICCRVRDQESSPRSARPLLSRRTRPLIVGVIGVLAVLIDAFLPTKVAFALTGSLGLAAAAYCLPCVLLLWLRPHGAGRHPLAAHPGAAVVLMFGCALLLGSTPVEVLRAASAVSPPQPALLSQLCNHSSLHHGAVAEGEL